MKSFVFIPLLGLCSTVLQAQSPVPPIIREPFFPPQVKQYIGLSDVQVGRIQGLNGGLVQFQAAKAARQVQVQIEIAQETQKQNLDAMALGLRYLELEVIRREVEAERQKVVRAVQALLTEPQRAKVAALQQVMADYPTACAGVGVNTVPAPPPVAIPRVTMMPEPPPVGGVIAAILPAPVVCGGAIATTVVRTGDFQQ